MSRPSFARGSLGLLSFALLQSPAAAQFAQSGQFQLPADPPPLLRDRIGGEWLNLETELIEPILWVRGGGGVGEAVVVVNEPDDRVVFLDPVTLQVVDEVFVGQGPATLARNPGTAELWVSVRNQSCVVVIDLRTRQVTHVLRRTIQTIETGMGNATTPGGIAFANGNAYVASSQTDELLVFDATAKTYTTAIPLKADHHGQDVALNDPFGVTAYGGKVWVTSHLSGNQTTARIAGGLDLDDGIETPEAGDDVNQFHLGPKNVAIAKLGSAPFQGLALPDFDVAVVNPAANQVESMVKGLGTTLFDVEGHPSLARLVVPNLDARNGDFTGESSFPDGRVVFNRLTWFDAATGALVGAPLVTEQPGLSADVVMPTDVEILPTGRMFVAGYSSANVGCFTAAGVFQGAVAASSGARGLAVNAAQTRLWVYCRGSNSVRAYDISNAALLPTYVANSEVALPDPTFDRVKAGRQQFLEPNSGAGTANCASCHIDGRMDGIAWNLSRSVHPAPGSGQLPADFIDRKGVMVTQTLLGLLGAWPLHWRGEQEGVESFNDAFAGLLHGNPLDPPELGLLVDYIESLEYPPNPRQNMNRELGHWAAGGSFVYNANCITCHFLPLGTSGDLACPIFGDGMAVSSVETALLRGLWLKESDEADIDPASGTATDVERVRVTGYGLLHEGVIDDLDQFLDEFFQQIAADHGIVRAFVDQLDTGLAPATAYSEILDDSTDGTSRADSIEEFLIPQADEGHCDLVARGLLDEGAGMVEVGLVWRRTTPTVPGHFESDDLNGATPVAWTFAQLEAKAAASQARLVFCGVPPGCGERMGIDRDRDGLRDRDEVQATTSADDPDSDDDGWWDGYDSAPTTTGSGMPSGVPAVVPGSIRLVYATTNAVKIEYETDLPSPTIVRFGISAGSLSWTAGDGPQPTGSGTTNHWKRRHTAFLGPQPDASPPLPMLKPMQVYSIRIDTQGQNGQTWSDAVRTSADIAWENGGPNPLSNFQALFNNGLFSGKGSSFRASDIAYLGGSKTGSDWTYQVRVWLEVTYGTPNAALYGASVPIAGRFTLHDSSGGYVSQSTSGLMQQDSVTGAWYADLSLTVAAPNHQTGDKIDFDLPMWIEVPLGSANKVGFPSLFDTNGTPETTDDFVHVGNWSDSVTHEEWIAP